MNHEKFVDKLPINAPLTFDAGLFELLTAAYVDGRLTFTRSIKKWSVTGKFPNAGYVYYLIYYFHLEGDKMTVLYNGPYEMLIEFENKLIKREQLYLYLIYQLTLKLQQPIIQKLV